MNVIIRIARLWILSAAVLAVPQTVLAQQTPAPRLLALQQAADKTAADWDTLAKGMEARVARLLPCDPRVRNAIDEVSRASELRFAALGQYLAAAAAKATEDSATVKGLLAGAEERAAQLSAEPAQVEQERAALEAQLANLGESAKPRPGLEDPLKTLTSIAAMVRQRVTQTQEQAARSQELVDLLRNLSAAAAAREGALAGEITTLTPETAHWREYYAARQVRAQTECSVIGGAQGLKKTP